MSSSTSATMSSRQRAMHEKVESAIEAAEWDALVAVGPENVQFLSGVWRATARGYLDRPHMVVWPAAGDPVRLGGIETLDAVRAESFIERFVGYDEKGARPPAVIVDKLAEVLREANLDRGTIGLEMLRTSVPFFERLRELLPDARFKPADEVFHRLRMVKTAAEIERMSEGARRTDEGVWNAISQSRAGETERELSARLQLGMLAKGCDAVTTCLVGAGERAATLGAPTGRVMAPGEVVRIDVNSVYDGYFHDMGRMAFVGEPSRAQAAAYAQQIQLGEAVRAFIKPGVRCCEVHRYYLEEAKRMGVELFIYPYIGIGHGIGVNADEYPKLNAQDETVIEPGMILNIEPDTYGPKREIFHVEDMVLVTDDGVKLLTRSRDWNEPPIITAP
jgi:Xaa-Pro dipeptidase